MISLTTNSPARRVTIGARMNLEPLLKNRIKMHETAPGFIDNFSAASVTVSRNLVGLTELCTRVISAIRNPVAIIRTSFQ